MLLFRKGRRDAADKTGAKAGAKTATTVGPETSATTGAYSGAASNAGAAAGTTGRASGLRNRLASVLRGADPRRHSGKKKKTVSPDLTAADLHRQALRNMRIIAILGILMILADLGLSLTADSVQIVSKDGSLYLVRPPAGSEPENITLHATVHSGSDVYEDNINIRLHPQEKKSDDADRESGQDPEVSTEDLIRSEFRSISSGFNSDLTERLVPLPDRLDSGEKIQWNHSRTSHAVLLIAMTAAMLVLVYRSRLKPLQQLALQRSQSVTRQLPSFINELVLLLNAGLVLSRAFAVTVEQLGEPDGEDTDYFRQNIRRIHQSMKHTNASLQEELQRFASESGVSELMRVSSIITDNINKGAELNRKLERESESLWLARKLHAEERGRLAETKMTLPLSIFLGVLIVITVSPALLQM